MTDYRLYCLSVSGKIQDAEWLEASCDEDAITLACARERMSDCELWDHGRLVARVPQQSPVELVVTAVTA